MFTANKWGDPEKLDHLVVSMKHPIALAALMSGGQTVKSHFATLPYSYQELKSGKIHNVITSYDIMGGQHSVLSMSIAEKFATENPKTYQAVIAAYLEAFKWIKANPEKAADTFIKYTKSKMNPADVIALLKDKSEIEFSEIPKHTMKYGNFLALATFAASWKDLHVEQSPVQRQQAQAMALISRRAVRWAFSPPHSRRSTRSSMSTVSPFSTRPRSI